MVIALKRESSKKSKVDRSDKFSPRRHIVFPRKLFIELVLSPKQTQKVLQWSKEGHSIIPMWFVNCERVLFLDQERFDEWILEKGKR